MGEFSCTRRLSHRSARWLPWVNCPAYLYLTDDQAEELIKKGPVPVPILRPRELARNVKTLTPIREFLELLKLYPKVAVHDFLIVNTNLDNNRVQLLKKILV